MRFDSRLKSSLLECYRRTLGSGWLTGALLWATIAGGPGLAAERIAVRYRVLERSIAVDSLARYAETGEADDDLEAYLAYLPTGKRDRLQALLSAQLSVGVVEVAQFLYAPQGEFLLRRISALLSTDVSDRSRETTFRGLRGAILQAAGSETGLTAIGILEAFPTPTLYLQVDEAIEALESVRDTLALSQRELEDFEARANAALALDEELADKKPADADTRASRWLPLQARGQSMWRLQSIAMRRAPDDRQMVIADLYVPKASSDRANAPPALPAPIVVISHGLGSDRHTFRYLAEHLASQGFAVLVPEHTGSNAKHLEALMSGIENDIAKPSEFADRPRDISLLLDELDRRVATDPSLRGRIDPNRAIVIGHSFGGYTALTLTGAVVDPVSLAQTCTAIDDRWSWNLSLLLQCRMEAFLEEEGSARQWHDDRIQGAIAISPIGSAIFGDLGLSHIDVPVQIVGGSADTVAPAYIEQIGLFDRLTVPDRQLVIWKGGTHFSPMGASEASSYSISLPSSVTGPYPELAYRSLEAMATAFARAYLLNDRDARALLSPAAIMSLSQPGLPLIAVDEQSARFDRTDAQP